MTGGWDPHIAPLGRDRYRRIAATPGSGQIRRYSTMSSGPPAISDRTAGSMRHASPVIPFSHRQQPVLAEGLDALDALAALLD